MAEIRVIEERANGIRLFEIYNEELRLVVSNLGCHVISVFAKDRDGQFGDVVLGFQNVEDCAADGTYMGAIVGRVANRIAGASFVLNGKEYPLAPNNAPNSLHGGNVGFNQKIFAHEILEDGICFTCQSAHMEEGYPGNMEVAIEYKIIGNEFHIVYFAEADEDTLCNLTNHSYFNLSAGKEKIYKHQLTAKADQIACVDSTCCANGTFLNVKGTPFDFTEPHELGERIADEHEQIILGGGYDHSFLLSTKEDQMTLYDPSSGRKLTVSTTLPCIQIYTGNFLAGSANGKEGKPYENRDGVALEAQYLPNSIHIEKEPGVILRKGEKYNERTIYRFEVE